MFNSVHPTSWTLRKIKSKGLDLKSLRRVQDVKNPFDSWEYRNSRKTKRESELTEEKVLDNSQKFIGLTQDQRRVVEKITGENEEILKNLKTKISRETAEELSAVDSDGEISEDLEFIVEELKISEKSKDVSLENSTEDLKSVDSSSKEKNTRDKYSQLKCEKKKEFIKQTDLEKITREEIALKTTELQLWATDVLDKPEELIPDLLSNQPDPDRPTSVLLHESVDIGALDVLLNACKPSLFDSKPPIRLNVVQEVAPPDSLVSNLQKTLGVTVSLRKKTAEHTVKPAFGYQRKDFIKKPKYGNWYVRPSLWSEKMKSSLKDVDDKTLEKNESQGLHEMIQKKLEEIKANQEREDAEILAENSMKSKLK